jgi:hypothetical protein
MRHALAWTLAGAALGLVVAWLGGRYLESLLFEVKARDLWNFAAVFGLLISISIRGGMAAVAPGRARRPGAGSAA